MASTPSPRYDRLREAYRSDKLVLYLGAGVSVPNNIPTWEKLVLAIYFLTVSDQKLGGWRPFSNYLYAISEWYLENFKEPLEITARKVKKIYESAPQGNREFLKRLYLTLYGSMLGKEGFTLQNVDDGFVRHHNKTLDAIVHLCTGSNNKIDAVITYNYDNLLEIALGDFPHRSIFSEKKIDPQGLPIYHVHGFVPLDPALEGSHADEIVFTEDQYHHVASNPYYWSNLIQIKSMASSTGLMLGLSLSDPNMRRLLDAVQKAPIKNLNYALLKNPSKETLCEEELDKIHSKAIAYLKKFQRGGIKTDSEMEFNALFSHGGEKSSGPGEKMDFAATKGPSYRQQIASILEQVKLFGREQQEQVLGDLGIVPIWYDRHEDIPGVLDDIFR